MNHEIDVLGFMTEELVPLTHNQGENDLRMTKVRQEISSGLRSMGGASENMPSSPQLPINLAKTRVNPKQDIVILARRPGPRLYALHAFSVYTELNSY